MFKSLFDSIKEKLFGKKPEIAEPVAQAPYKVEPQPPVVEPSPVTVVTPEPAPVPEPVVTPEPAPLAAETKPKRARARGKFKGDDKLTVETNEAWEGGKAPAKKPKKPRNDKSKLKVVTADTATPKKKSTTKKK